jgi:8-hydroxy-5-deazaflavin:NADPH oxidoreductase
MEDEMDKVYAVLGGTGSLGFALALRLASSGRRVIIGSRRPEKAQNAAARAREILAENSAAAIGLRAEENGTAAALADVVAITVPYAQQKALLWEVAEHLQGKIVIDATVPLQPSKLGTVQLPEGGSAAVAAQAMLGEGVRLVSAFQNVAADKLQSLEPLDCDVLVAGNDKPACMEVVGLIKTLGLTGYYAGPLANSAATEALTSLLIQINRQFGCQAGIRITGIK